jgi:hypothetical protein
MSKYAFAAAGGPARANGVGVRGAVDPLVQGALVELFAAHDVPVAPSPRSPAQLRSAVPEVSVMVAFSPTIGGELSGKLTLSLSSALLELMLARSSQDTSVKLDWARELASQLMGRIKNRFLPFGVRLGIGRLLLVDSQQLEASLKAASNVRVYIGRSLRGEVLVTLQGTPEEHTLTYVGMPPALEGSAIWF